MPFFIMNRMRPLKHYSKDLSYFVVNGLMLHETHVKSDGNSYSQFDMTEGSKKICVI